ncbi:MAG: calcium-binding protein [Geminicoccaceae bacterium]
MTVTESSLGGIGTDQTLYVTMTGDGDNDTIDATNISNGTVALAVALQTIVGGTVQFTINGNGGDDDITGSAFGDIISGGNGADLVFAGDGDDVVSGGNGGDDLWGEGGNDILNGEGGRDNIYGGDGDDTIDGGAGADNLYGMDGNDTIDGGDGKDLIGGGKGDDVLNGGAGNDTIYGNGGQDVIDGGEGNDTLYGGGGADIYTFSSFSSDAPEHDFIKGFGWNDQIDLSSVAHLDEVTISKLNGSTALISLHNANGAFLGDIRVQGAENLLYQAGEVTGDQGGDALISGGATIVLNDAVIQL